MAASLFFSCLVLDTTAISARSKWQVEARPRRETGRAQVRVLVELGADVQALNHKGNNASQLALEYGHKNLNLLLRAMERTAKARQASRTQAKGQDKAAPSDAEVAEAQRRADALIEEEEREAAEAAEAAKGKVRAWASLSSSTRSLI
jgi:hypothetical protein